MGWEIAGILFAFIGGGIVGVLITAILTVASMQSRVEEAVGDYHFSLHETLLHTDPAELEEELALLGYKKIGSEINDGQIWNSHSGKFTV